MCRGCFGTFDKGHFERGFRDFCVGKDRELEFLRATRTGFEMRLKCADIRLKDESEA